MSELLSFSSAHIRFGVITDKSKDKNRAVFPPLWLRRCSSAPLTVELLVWFLARPICLANWALRGPAGSGQLRMTDSRRVFKCFQIHTTVLNAEKLCIFSFCFWDTFLIFCMSLKLLSKAAVSCTKCAYVDLTFLVSMGRHINYRFFTACGYCSKNKETGQNLTLQQDPLIPGIHAVSLLFLPILAPVSDNPFLCLSSSSVPLALAESVVCWGATLHLSCLFYFAVACLIWKRSKLLPFLFPMYMFLVRRSMVESGFCSASGVQEIRQRTCVHFVWL